jgi:hypothetical protein
LTVFVCPRTKRGARHRHRLDLLQLADQASLDDVAHVAFGRVGGGEPQTHAVDRLKAVAFLDAGLVGRTTFGDARYEQAEGVAHAARVRRLPIAARSRSS